MNTQKQNVSKAIGEILYQLSGIELNEQTMAASFIELGFDSLFLIQFSTRLKKELGIDVTFRQMLSELSSTASLIQHLDDLSDSTLAKGNRSVLSADEQHGGSAVGDSNRSTESEQTLQDGDFKNIAHAISQPDVSQQKQAPQNNVQVSQQTTSQTQLESLVSKQLEIMAQQLAMLSGTVVENDHQTQSVPLENFNDTAGSDSSGLNPTVQPQFPSATDTHAVASSVRLKVDGSEPALTAKDKPQPFGAIARIQTGGSDELSETQRDWLIRFTHRYNVKTAKSKAYTQRNREVHADPRVVSGFKPLLKELVYPIVAKQTSGCRIWDQDGNEYIDALNGFGSNYFGYANPDITQAVVGQLWQGAEIGPQNPLTGDAARLICEFTGMDRVGFCNTGSEAVMGAMRIARTVTGRDLIVIFSGSYHGIFDEVLVRGTPHLRSIPAAPGITDKSVQNVLVLEYGTDESIAIIEERIGEIAAVMVEPVQSRRPDFQPREFLHRLRVLTQAQDIPFIFDEVITGFRTAPGGAQEFFGIQADIATYGKVVGGGMQIGVVAGRKKFMDALDGGSWQFGDRSEPEEAVTYFAGTFVRHPASIAACHAALTLLKEGGPALQQETNALTTRLVSSLNTFFQHNGAAISVTHFGSLWRMEYKQTESYGDLLFYLLREKGIHIYDRFPCFLTLKHTEEDVNSIIKAIQDSVVELQSVGFIGSEKKTSPDNSPNEPLKTHYPLTRIQSNIWLTTQFSEAGNIAYNEPLLLRLRGMCDMSAMKQAINIVYERHDALHARFSANGEFQYFPAPVSLPLPVHDFSAGDAVYQTRSLDEAVERVSRTPFDLIRGPLVRIEIVRHSKDSTVLICSAHHIICDGWSWNALLNEIGEAYSAIVSANSPDFNVAPSFSDFVVQDYEYERDSKDALAVDHWVNQLGDTPLYIDLPTDRARPPVREFAGDTITHHIHEETYIALKALSVRENTSIFTLLFSVFMVLMSRTSQQQKLVISTPVAGQMLTGQFDLVGCCIRLLPIAADVDESLPFGQFLNGMKTIVLDGYENLNADFKNLLKEKQKTCNSNRTPFSEVCFNVDRDEAGISFKQLSVDVEQAKKIAVINDVFFNVNESSKGLKIDCDFNTALFDQTTIQRWIHGFEILLKAVAYSPDLPIRQLNSMPVEQSAFLLKHGVAKQYPVLDGVRLNELFDQKAGETPDAVAVIYTDHKATYSELLRHANKLANHLTHLGMSAGSRIGIHMQRTPMCLVAMLATMKVGGVCIPLDPLYPMERLRFMIDDSMADLILTNERLLNEQFGADSEYAEKLLPVDTNWSVIDKQSTDHDVKKSAGQDVAFILYTSASTGRPAGVRTLHSAHLSRFEWMWREFPFSTSDICCQKTSICFIDSIWELFGPLLKGVPSVFVSADVLLDSHRLLETMQSNRISRIVLVPSLLPILVASARKKACHLPDLLLCFSSGDVLSPKVAREFNEQFPHCKLVNLYGTTEVSGDATFHEYLPSSKTKRVDIGRPIDNACVYLLDGYGNPVPVGSVGEICIGGGILAAGYHNQPTLNAERYISDSSSFNVPSFAKGRGMRLFKTGDLGRVGDDGSIEYIGRKDKQIQVNGIRIDPAEVEKALVTHHSVAECLIESRADVVSNQHRTTDNGHSLVAYLRTHDDSPVDAKDIKAHMKKLLPVYMVPQQIFQLRCFPLTPNGKLDREQLLEQGFSELENTQKTRIPRTRAEQVLLKCWIAGIGTTEINMEDSYFDLGSSFNLIKIVSALQEDYGINVSVQDFLQNPTLESLAKFIAPQLKNSDALDIQQTRKSIFSLQQGSDGMPLLLIPPAGVTDVYFMPMLAKIDASIPVFSISPGEILEYNSIASYAEHLATQWMAINTSGPCVIAGMCMGTHLAFELTRQLKLHGHDVRLLIVIDHEAPETLVSPASQFFLKKGPIAPAIRAFNHLRAGRVSRLMLRASIAIERNFDDDLNHYMKLLEWQNRISSDYQALPCSTDILLIQSEEYAELRDIARQWEVLTSGSLIIETLENIMHDDFTEDEPKPLYSVAEVINSHLQKADLLKTGGVRCSVAQCGESASS
ncbi:MAG: amino acid adenylation domain-containing protein [Granulosicoccus sp.]